MVSVALWVENLFKLPVAQRGFLNTFPQITSLALRDKSENFDERGNSLGEPRDIPRKECAQLCTCTAAVSSLADGGAALPFGQDGRGSKSLPWDVPGQSRRKRRRVWSVPVICPSLLLFPCVGIIWCRGTMVSPRSRTPSPPGALPKARSKGISQGATGALSPSSSSSPGAEGSGP